jgi:hypothetical protein
MIAYFAVILIFFPDHVRALKSIFSENSSNRAANGVVLT